MNWSDLILILVNVGGFAALTFVVLTWYKNIREQSDRRLEEYLGKKHEFDLEVYQAQLELSKNFLRYIKHKERRAAESRVLAEGVLTPELVAALEGSTEPRFQELAASLKENAPEGEWSEKPKRDLEIGVTVVVEFDKDITTREIVATIYEEKNITGEREQVAEVRQEYKGPTSEAENDLGLKKKVAAKVRELYGDLTGSRYKFSLEDM